MNLKLGNWEWGHGGTAAAFAPDLWDEDEDEDEDDADDDRKSCWICDFSNAINCVTTNLFALIKQRI